MCTVEQRLTAHQWIKFHVQTLSSQCTDLPVRGGEQREGVRGGGKGREGLVGKEVRTQVTHMGWVVAAKIFEISNIKLSSCESEGKEITTSDPDHSVTTIF